MSFLLISSVGRGNDQFRKRKRRCIKAADAVICISEATREDLERFYSLNTSSSSRSTFGVQ